MTDTDPASENLHPQQVTFITGMSGAGKTTVLRVLEDLGWETIDNLPIRLLDDLIGGAKAGEGQAPLAIGLDSRTRGFEPAAIIDRIKRWNTRADLSLNTIFLDCRSAELERRYNETRRRHPLAQGRTAADGIRADRELLEPLRRWAELVIDTSELSINDLQTLIRSDFAGEESAGLSLTVSSFGFARGMPPLADFVFDMRFLDNPHWHDDLRDLTGLDPEVAVYLQEADGFEEIFERIRALIFDLIPRFGHQGKAYVHLAFGCTGGRHRSVYTAERMADALRDGGFSPTVFHRNLASRAADIIEGPRAQA